VVGVDVVVLITSWANNLICLRQGEIETTAVLVREALYHAQLRVTLLKNEYIIEHVPVEDWLCFFLVGVN